LNSSAERYCIQRLSAGEFKKWTKQFIACDFPSFFIILTLVLTLQNMLTQEYFIHYPFRFVWVGGLVLSLFAFSFLFVLVPLAQPTNFPVPPRKAMAQPISCALPPLELGNTGCSLLWEIISIRDEIQLFQMPGRPCRGDDFLQIRLKSSGLVQTVAAPCRVYLHFNDQGILSFETEKGPFWVDLTKEKDGFKIDAVVEGLGTSAEHQEFIVSSQIPPIQKSDELTVGSPLKILADAQWVGTDLASSLVTKEVRQRFKIGLATLNVSLNDWIGWIGGQWVKIENPAPLDEVPIARLCAVGAKQAEWEAWGERFVRLACNLQPDLGVSLKAEDWITRIRVRSDKQISCVLEKQSLILHRGDWVLKERGRWRVLRKNEEREQLVQGTLIGDLFILDKIDSGKKNIQGRFLGANRTQMIHIDITVPGSQLEKNRSMARKTHHSRQGKHS
jgi:hypothetical protein